MNEVTTINRNNDGNDNSNDDDDNNNRQIRSTETFPEIQGSITIVNSISISITFEEESCK